jgi:hypothetical protein
MTVAELIEEARQGVFRDLSPRRALVMLNRVLSELYAEADLRPDAQSVSVVAGQGEYDLSPMGDVQQVYFMTSEEESEPLSPTSPADLDHDQPGWRTRAYRGQPRQYYVASAPNAESAKWVFGLLPAPDTSTDGSGFPIVRVFGSRPETLQMGDQIPESLLSAEACVFGLRLRHSLDVGRDDRAGYYMPLYNEAKRREIMHLKAGRPVTLRAAGTDGQTRVR